MARSQPDFWQYACAAESSASQLSLWLSGISGSDDWVMEAIMVLNTGYRRWTDLVNDEGGLRIRLIRSLADLGQLTLVAVACLSLL